MQTIDFKLGKIAGVLDAFSWINTKTNHSYCFEIEKLPDEDNCLRAFEKYIFEYYPEAIVRLEQLSIDDELVHSTIRNWLFGYQKSPNIDEDFIGLGSESCYLDDKYKAFSLTDESYKKDFLEGFLSELIALIQANTIYKVHIKTNTWYEAAWDDFIFEGKKGRIFLHLGVSD